MAEVLAAARPLVDLLWTRETEHGVFDTPERRAALEARLREIARGIGDESVRRHYAQAFDERVGAFFPKPERANGEWRAANRGRGRQDSTRYSPLATHSSGIPVSDRLTRSGILASRSVLPRREVALVATMMNHPALMFRHLDQFAHLELANGPLAELRAVLIEMITDDAEIDGETLRARLGTSRFASLVTRLDEQISTTGEWTATAEAADEDAERGWLQALTLHHRQRTLHKELKDAEAALASETSEVNFARLVDIQKQLANVEGTEALIEGFGSSSGRRARSM
jgi:DNA primase